MCIGLELWIRNPSDYEKSLGFIFAFDLQELSKFWSGEDSTVAQHSICCIASVVTSREAYPGKLMQRCLACPVFWVSYSCSASAYVLILP
jgi:hypothetical protein